MVGRSGDGSVGDADYQHLGTSYARYRRPDRRIAERITAALGSARTVLNVGAGAGSYEPTDREVTPVEPSETMRAQRPDHLPTALDAVAEHLPFPDDSFDAAMTTFSVHQWRDTGAGLREIRRVTRGPVVILTCDPRLLDGYWLNEYAPRVIEAEQRRYPPLSELESGLGTAFGPLPCPSRWIAPTGSTRPTTDVPRCCSTLRPVNRVRRGASSTRRHRIGSQSSWNTISSTGRGTGGSATSAPNPSTRAAWSSP